MNVDPDYTVKISRSNYTVTDHNLGLRGEKSVRRESKSNAHSYLDTCAGSSAMILVQELGEEDRVLTGSQYTEDAL